MRTWMAKHRYSIDSPCLYSRVFVLAPQFRAPRVAYRDREWRGYAREVLHRKMNGLDAAVVARGAAAPQRRRLKWDFWVGLATLVAGGFVDFDRHYAAVVLDEHADPTRPDTRVPLDRLQFQLSERTDHSGPMYVTLYQMLTDPSIVGADGRRFSMDLLFPDGATARERRRRWELFFGGWFAPLFYSGKVSAAGWLAREPDERAVWDRVLDAFWQAHPRRESPDFADEIVDRRSCVLIVVAAVLDRKRQIAPDRNVRYTFWGPLPSHRLTDPSAPRRFTDWAAALRLIPERRRAGAGEDE